MDEVIILIITIGVFVALNTLGFLMISVQIDMQAKKIKKETQEIKTRLTQARKDLNHIEKKVSK